MQLERLKEENKKLQEKLENLGNLKKFVTEQKPKKKKILINTQSSEPAEFNLDNEKKVLFTNFFIRPSDSAFLNRLSR
jgi:hypothetical protein